MTENLEFLKLKGIKRTTGQHPGGLLIVPKEIKIEDFTPLNYPADNKKSEVITTHFEYNFLSSENFLKIDILGHDEPTVLQKLRKKTKAKLEDESNFKDEKVMKMFEQGNTLGIPEFGTDSTIRMLKLLKPTKFSHLVKISGFSHGTNVWTSNQKNYFNHFYNNKKQFLILSKFGDFYSGGLDFNELIACREDIIDRLVMFGISTKESFLISEYIRKGKFFAIPEELKIVLEKKLGNDDKGKLYYNILQKITYIFPRPHAIAYTMMALRIAYYKIYHSVEFYSILLTHHVVIYDIWLMNLEEKLAELRIKKMFEKDTKTRKKDLLSIFTTISILKDETNDRNSNFSYENKMFFKKIENFFLNFAEEKQGEINILNEIKKISNYKKFDKIRRASVRERELVFSLKVAIEIKDNFKFNKTVNFNKSESDVFIIENNEIYFPFSSVSGIGKKNAEKIIEYRKNGKKITKNWKEELLGVLNQNHIEEFEIMEKMGLVGY